MTKKSNEEKYYNNENNKYHTPKPLNVELEDLRDDQKERLTDSKTFCMIPWIHLHSFPNGQAYPCCSSDSAYPVGSFKKDTMKTVWNNKPLRDMRNNMLENKECKECTRCYERENNGFFSMRNESNKRFGHHIDLVDKTNKDGSLDEFKLRYYDIRFSNLCNFSCRTCGTWFSSSWYKEQKDTHGSPGHPQIMYAGRTEEDMWEQMQEHIPNLEQIYFAGGEPLIMEEHYKLLDELVDRKMFDVKLLYNTNFSKFMLKDKSVLEYWKKFNSVSVGASLDAMGSRAEYMRKGTVWTEIEENRKLMQQECPNVDFYVSSTVSIYNILHITDFHRDWAERGLVRAEDWNINILQSPEHCRIDVLPEVYKDIAREKINKHLEWLKDKDPLQRATEGFKGILQFINDNQEARLDEFFRVNNFSDKYRKEVFEDAFPEYKDLRSYSALPKKICMLPWVSIETSPTGTIRPCCLATEEITKPDGTKYNLNKDTLKEAFNSEYMQDLRKQFLQDKQPETCKRCWVEEDAGRTSKRMHNRVKLKDHYHDVDWHNTDPDQPWFLDLKLGNICNLKCRICGSWSSSKWAKEEVTNSPSPGDPKLHIAYEHLQKGTWPRNNDLFWDNLKTLLPHVKYFEFTGGEPFLIDQHFKILEYAVEQGYAKDIDIHYNTNGTVFPEKHYLWKEFKHVEIAFSIDNTGSRFEYERFGAKWYEVQDNIKKITAMKSDKLSTQICTTVNIQNVYYLPEIIEWIETQEFDYVYFNMLHDPQHMNISNMTFDAMILVMDKLTSISYKEEYADEINKILNLVNPNDIHENKEFNNYMKKTDKFRKQKFSDTHPEIAKAMGYDK
jgi:radical SAM protein with 4Fe4S-binding SPASM domain